MYECNHCDFESDSEKGLNIHTSQMHKESQKKTYTCESCCSKFEDYPSRREGRGREKFYCSNQCKYSDEKVDKINTSCGWCGSDIEKYPSSVGQMGDYSIDNHFCDKECESKWKSTHWTGEDHPSYDGGNEDVVCEECGETYAVKPSVADKTRFCSNECQNKNQTNDLVVCNCDYCGDAFERRAYNIKGESVFCSSSCFDTWMSNQRRGDDNPQWVGGKEEYYGENWNEERRKTLDAAEYKCELCGQTREEHYGEYGFDLDVHHRIPLRTFDMVEHANFQDNLVVCCRNCHQSKLEREPVPHNDIRAPA